MAWWYVGISATAALVGGKVGADGAMASGKAAYNAGQLEYHQELEKTHYDAKIMQRQMLQQMHYQMAQAGASGTGDRTLAQRGLATVLCVSGANGTEFVIGGAGLS